MASSKIILVNGEAGKKKYGASNWKKILAAVDALIKADKARGIGSEIFQLDSATQMKKVGGKAVASPTSDQQTKLAIDAIFTSLHPHYLMILGGPDLIPHVNLRNPIPEVEDKTVPSDLPYACDTPYALDIEKFKGPSRVLGRLPDITGEKDPAYLLALLDTACQWQSRPASAYKSYFGLTAEVWKGSTRTSVRKLFNSTKTLNLVPPETPPWKTAELGARMHFINCHGADIDHRFFGEEGEDFPMAHASDQLNGVLEGTVVAAECCYGARLYKPRPKVSMAICNRYLEKGAYGFLGSTNIAYGPADGNDLADLVCIYFIQHIQNGASLGRALLEARQTFIKGAQPVGPQALKTLAQFNLLGDPSIQPIITPKAKASAPKAKAKTPLAMVRGVAATPLEFFPKSMLLTATAPAALALVNRSLRRQTLFDRGREMSQSTVAAVTTQQTNVTGDLRKQMLDMARERNMGDLNAMVSFELESNLILPTSKKASLPATKARGIVARSEKVSNSSSPRILVAVMSGPKSSPKGKSRSIRSLKEGQTEKPSGIITKRLLVATERNGKIQSVEEFVAR